MKWYLGIDVSKGYADFVLLSDHLEKMEETFQLDDTRSGHEKLKSWLGSIFKRYPGLQIDSAVESTGGFENNWYSLICLFLNAKSLTLLNEEDLPLLLDNEREYLPQLR